MRNFTKIVLSLVMAFGLLGGVNSVKAGKFIGKEFTSVAQLSGKKFAIVNKSDGKAFCFTDAQDLDYQEYSTAFSSKGALFSIESAVGDGVSGYYYIRTLQMDGTSYAPIGGGGYLNSTNWAPGVCFTLGLNGRNGQDGLNLAVWNIKYVKGRGFTLMNIGTGKYYKTATKGAYDNTPAYFTFCELVDDEANANLNIGTWGTSQNKAFTFSVGGDYTKYVIEFPASTVASTEDVHVLFQSRKFVGTVYIQKVEVKEAETESAADGDKTSIRVIDYSTAGGYGYYRLGEPNGSYFDYDATERALVIKNTSSEGNNHDLQPIIIDNATLALGKYYTVEVTMKAAVNAQDIFSENIITNGDMEGSDVSCFFKKIKGEDLSSAAIENSIGKGGSRGIKVQSTTDAEANEWDSQFFIRFPYVIPEGTMIKVEFDYKTSIAKGDNSANVMTTQTQYEPTQYNSSDCIGDIDFNTDWTSFSKHITITEAMATGNEIERGVRAIAFNLAKNKTATDFYFDNIKVYLIEANENAIATATALLDGATIAIGAEGNRTYSYNHPLDFSEVSGLKAYAITAFNPAVPSLTLTPVTAAPANTGLFLVGSEGDYPVPVVASADAIVGNMLVSSNLTDGVIEPFEGEDTRLVLAGSGATRGFYPLSKAGNMGENKAYLQLLTSEFNSIPQGAPLSFVFEDETTGITKITETKEADSEWYTLSGVKLHAKPTQKGIYINNGKKVVFK